MNKKINNIMTKIKKILKKDTVKIISFSLLISVSIIVILYLLACLLVDGLIAENKIRQKEIDRLYKEGICNYEEPCEWP